MKYSVAFYCPDQHLTYNINTLNYHGVGGGVTARVRIAHALAARGHNVTLFVNCPKNESLNGVIYRNNRQFKNIRTDIFIASTSGDGLDLSELCKIEIDAKLNILLAHGIEPPNGIDCLQFDFIYSPSNFVRALSEKSWEVDPAMLFTTYRGVRGENFNSDGDLLTKRDPYGLFYAGHPKKGLGAALKVIRLLRQNDSRFSLHVFGGYGLWGDEEVRIEEEQGVFYYGLIGQLELAQRMQTLGFCINLQAIEDTFGMVNIEAMRAGCIVIASEVGAYPEVVNHEENGFIVRGDHSKESTIIYAAQLIIELANDPNRCSSIRENAITSPLDWITVAKTWEGHWDWMLENEPYPTDLSTGCTRCGGPRLLLADGYHCVDCGRYEKSLPE